MLRRWWATARLVLLLAVIAIGAPVVGGGIGAAMEAAPDSAPSAVRWRIAAGAAAALVALVTATALSVSKPGGRRVPLPGRRGALQS